MLLLFEFWSYCFTCPNKRVMIIKTNNEVKTSGEDEEEKMKSLEDVDNVCVEYPVKGEIFVARRALNMHVKLNDLEDQREKIFHTRCHVQNMVCSLIIDGGSCTNVVITELVEKLNLHNTRYAIPYKLK